MMPKLGESVTEGTISKWLISPGDEVRKYDPIAEVITDKVNAEIPSSFAGIIQELKADEDQTLAVGEVICTILVTEHEAVEKIERVMSEESHTARVSVSETSQSSRYSPAVLKLSQEHGIELTTMIGTGMGGRITRKDILKVVESRNQTKSTPVLSPFKKGNVVAPSSSLQTVHSQERGDGDIVIPVSAVRKAIATNMSRSKQEIPHAWMMVEVDASNVVTLRETEKQRFKEREGFNLTYFAFFVKAVAQALKEFPQLNATWSGDTIIQKREIHLNIAVAAEDTLFVPVIKHADEKSIKGIAREITELAEKARNGRLKAEDVQGGTFTVNNTGAFGSSQSSGIINYPQAAILQIESIKKRPVIINGMIAIRDMVNICLSLDHRVLDGLICGKFLARVKEIVENMSSETTSLY